MKCIICHGQDIQVAEVQEELRRDNDIVYVSILIPVCQTCGERYYHRQTIRYLEEMERRLKAGTVKLTEVGRVYEAGPG